LKAGKAALQSGDFAAFGDSRVALVLGAGNSAMDVARTARGLGLRAVCVDWFDERFALARPRRTTRAAGLIAEQLREHRRRRPPRAARSGRDRVWLEITRRGYVASPLTQLIEVARTNELLCLELQLGMHPHVGHAPDTPPSRRRPLQDLLIESP